MQELVSRQDITGYIRTGMDLPVKVLNGHQDDN